MERLKRLEELIEYGEVIIEKDSDGKMASVTFTPFENA